MCRARTEIIVCTQVHRWNKYLLRLTAVSAVQHEGPLRGAGGPVRRVRLGAIGGKDEGGDHSGEERVGPVVERPAEGRPPPSGPDRAPRLLPPVMAAPSVRTPPLAGDRAGNRTEGLGSVSARLRAALLVEHRRGGGSHESPIGAGNCGRPRKRPSCGFVRCAGTADLCSFSDVHRLRSSAPARLAGMLPSPG